MCGIAGFWGSFEIFLLHKMNIALTHCGPDDSGAMLFSSKHEAHQSSKLKVESTGHEEENSMPVLISLLRLGSR